MCGFIAEGGEKLCQVKKAVLAQERTREFSIAAG